MRSRTSIAVGIAASILAVLPATAVAAKVDQRSDRCALTAYHNYLQGAALVASDNGLLRSLTGKLKGISTTGATASSTPSQGEPAH